MTDSNLARLIKQLGQPLACLDIETTGGHLERDRITEIGIVTLSTKTDVLRMCTRLPCLILSNRHQPKPKRNGILDGISTNKWA